MRRAAEAPTAAILLAGQRIPQARLQQDWARPELQARIAEARRRFGYALCACRGKPLRLQIRLREGRFHLAVWPHEGPQHDSLCIFFRDELADAASPPPAAAAASARADASGAGARIPLVLAAGDPLQAGTVLVSMRMLAARLWTAASLCQWYPSWRRDWGRVRFELLKAAQAFLLQGAPAEQGLFIPRPYRASVRDQVHAAWDCFARQLEECKQGEAHVLVAPVRKFEPGGATQPARLHLRHLLARIVLTRACEDFLMRHCRSALAESGCAAAVAAARTHAQAAEVIGFFSVDAAGRGAVRARAAWLMTVHPSSFIPAAGAAEMLLVEALVRGGYAFQRLLSLEKTTPLLEPEWLLRHVRGPQGRAVARAALVLATAGPSGAVPLQPREDLARRLAERGVPTWTWACHGAHAATAPPLLPPPDQASAADAYRRLREIAAAAELDYCYGPSSKFRLAGAEAVRWPDSQGIPALQTLE